MNAATTFTPWASLAGGGLIGLAAALYMALFGRVAGVSGILGHLLPPERSRASLERLGFAAGLLAGPVAMAAATGRLPATTLVGSLSHFAVAGLIVGVGVTLGSGCTSGHGVCGLSRFSRRSIAATLVFMTVAVATVFARRHMMGM